MSQRPEPVTSKFRRHYSNDLFPVYINNNDSSLSESTSSLISVLHHDSYEEEKIDDNDFIDCLKINEVSDDEIFCKRIIARQPQYPGARVTMVTHQHETINNFRLSSVKTPQKNSNKNKFIKPTSSINGGVQILKINNENISKERKCARKICDKSQRVSSEHSSYNKKPVIHKLKSDDSYSNNDFSSMSEINFDVEDSAQNPVEHKSGKPTPSSLSILNNDQTNEDGDNMQEDNCTKILTAWEAWYLKKEKQKRKKQEKESLKEKEMREKGNEEKIKRKEICQEKIKSWLFQKEERQRKEAEINKIIIENENNEKEKKKVETIKQSSKKYVEWKLKKKKREIMAEKQAKDLKVKIEAEKMIKQAKAANAFQRWFEEHKDHQLPVPYSYGISDGKLTSYYDKTSNPPPSFFNPDPWKSIIDIKN